MNSIKCVVVTFFGNSVLSILIKTYLAYDKYTKMYHAAIDP